MSGRNRAAGETVGRYKILRKLAQGGMGTVFVAEGPLGREVALKLLRPGGRWDREARFQLEAEAAARLRHPGVVAVHDFGQDEQGQTFLVMDLIPGASLQQRLDEQGPLPPGEASRVARDVAEALAYAHGQGVVHRDVKPGNVLLTPDGRALLTDFGLARVVDQSQHLTRTGQILGTPAFMPPEQVRGERERIGPAADVYSLGATLYAALTGEPPFGEDLPVAQLAAVLHRRPAPPSTLAEGVGPGLDQVVARCLEKDPARRYASAQDLAADLARLAEGRRPARPPSARGALVGLTAMALLVGAALLALLSTRDPPPSTPAAEPPPAAAAEPDRLQPILERVDRLDPEQALDLLRRAPELTTADAERLRGAALQASIRLVAAESPQPATVLGLLQLLAAVEPDRPGSRPDDTPLAEGVIRLAAALEDRAPEKLGDERVVQLLEGLARTGRRPPPNALIQLFESTRFSVRPRSSDYPQLYFRLLGSLARLEVDVPGNLYRGYAELIRGPRGREDGPLQAMVRTRIEIELHEPNHPRRKELVEELVASPAFPRLGPRNQAFVLLEAVEVFPEGEAQREALDRAEQLAPELPRVHWRRARIRYQRGVAKLLQNASKAADHFARGAERAARAFALQGEGRLPDPKDLELYVRLLVLADREVPVDALLQHPRLSNLVRRRLEAVREEARRYRAQAR